jgi:hypothetical protein
VVGSDPVLVGNQLYPFRPGGSIGSNCNPHCIVRIQLNGLDILPVRGNPGDESTALTLGIAGATANCPGSVSAPSYIIDPNSSGTRNGKGERGTFVSCTVNAVYYRRVQTVSLNRKEKAAGPVRDMFAGIFPVDMRLASRDQLSRLCGS